MKVLFAVSNDNVSNSIIKKYQEKYKEIITSKNVYYFDAIIKELQKDKSYDVVVIGEDLEPISNNNYDTIDKIIFEKLDSISDEAYKVTGEDIPIILICSDRRTKSDQLLVKLFGIGVYNALLGNDRLIDNVCDLINKPRSKKEAKIYYKVNSDDVNYRPEKESEVSETEIQNILSHYKKIGSNEKKCIQSFNDIAAQYTDTQLRIITKFLPLNVKAILEKGSTKYQQLMTGGTVLTNGRDTRYQDNLKKPNKQNLDILTKDLEKTKLTKPVIIPSTMNIDTSMEVKDPVKVPMPKVVDKNQTISNQSNDYINSMINPKVDLEMNDNSFNQDNNINNSQINNNVDEKEEKPKRRGRPRKVNTEVQTVESQVQDQAPKRGRGRPRKTTVKQEETQKSNETVNLFDLDSAESDNTSQGNNEDYINKAQNEQVPSQDLNLFGMSEEIDNSSNNLELENNNPYEINNLNNPYITDNIVQQPVVNENNNLSYNNNQNLQNNDNNQNMQNPYSANNPYDNNLYNNPYDINSFGNEELVNTNNKKEEFVESNFIAQNSKFVSFVGTSKNGTSFIVNNLAELLSQKGINTAILDLTKNKNSYYMFTDNDEALMQTAGNSIKNLAIGNVSGIKVNKNLTVFTSLPGDDQELENVDIILQTLDNNFSAVLMDCDFETNTNYFVKSTEIYLVQSMDVLTIQPLTLFLSELKLKNVLDENKLRVIINKEIKLKLLNDKMILGGMAKYNEPSMTLQRDLFNPNTIKYVVIPFEEQTYARYLESIAVCQVSLKGYSERFLGSLDELANMVYPLVQGSSNQNYSGYSNYSPPNYEKAKKGFFKGKKQQQTQFSSGVNDTLNKMRSNY